VKALLLQVPSLLFVTLFKYTTWFSSDLMLVPWCVAGLCLAVELTHVRFSGGVQTRTAVLAGIVCTLGIFTKLTFFPILLILFAACHGWRTRLIAGGSGFLPPHWLRSPFIRG
jgi:4-amino-4-deoxy-L-arabinose transferase-like glycosyltransferase